MITIGIDPHKSSLTAVAVDGTGEPVATAPADTPAVVMTISDRFCGDPTGCCQEVTVRVGECGGWWGCRGSLWRL